MGTGSRIRTVTAVLGLACLTTLVGNGAAGGLPRTAADAADLRITITTLSPTLLDPDGTLLITARVVNASDQTLRQVGARLRVGAEAFGSRAELSEFSGGSGELGTVPAASLVDVAPELPPGGEVEVRMAVPAQDLGLVGGFGVHPLTLELRVDEPTGERRTAGAVRTSIVSSGGNGSGRAGVPTVRLALVWPLVGTPGRNPDGLLSTDAATALAASVRPTGRLGTLLAAGTGQPVSWFVDGALLEDIRSLSTGNGLPQDLQPDPLAGAWLTSLAQESARAETDFAALPYADPDLVAVQRAGLQSDLLRAAALGAETVSLALNAEVQQAPPWPGSGVANKPTLEMLQGKDFDANRVILTSAFLQPQPQFAGTPDALADLEGQPDLGLVTSDATISALVGAGPDKAGGLVLASQRLLAETAMVAAERPNDPRSLVVTPPRRWNPPTAWALAVRGFQAPWLKPVTLAELEADPGDAPPATPKPYSDAAKAAEVSPAQLAAVTDARTRLTRFSAVVADPAAFLATYDPALLSAQSLAWRGKGRAAGRTYTAELTNDVRATVTAVRLKPRGSVTLSSRAGIIPLAVQNSLDQEVRVRVRVTSTPAVRLQSAATEVITIPAGRTASVDVAAEATADATFPVVAVLLTEAGEPFGKPVTFTVRATGYGQVARIVVGSALILLAATVVMRVARRIRLAQSGSAASGTALTLEDETLDP